MTWSRRGTRRPLWLPGPVTFGIDCTDDAGAVLGAHPITVAPDFRITTGRDHDAERIAAALLGRRLTCDRLESVAACAVRALNIERRGFHETLGRPGRDAPPRWMYRPMRYGDDARPRHVVACEMDAIHDAQARSSSLGDVSALTRRVVAAVKERFPGLVRRPRDAEHLARLFAEPDGLDILWDAGIHPDLVPGLWQAIGRPHVVRSVFDYVDAASARRHPRIVDVDLELDSVLVALPPHGQPLRGGDVPGIVLPHVVRSMLADPAFTSTIRDPHSRIAGAVRASLVADLDRALPASADCQKLREIGYGAPLPSIVEAFHFSRLFTVTLPESTYCTLVALSVAGVFPPNEGPSLTAALCADWRVFFPGSWHLEDLASVRSPTGDRGNPD